MPDKYEEDILVRNTDVGRADMLQILELLDRTGHTDLDESLIDALGFRREPSIAEIQISSPLTKRVGEKPEREVHATVESQTIGIWICESRVDVSEELKPPANKHYPVASSRSRKSTPEITPTLRSSQMLNLWDAALNDKHHSLEIDVPQLVLKLAMAKPVTALPKLKRSAFVADVVLLMDRRNRVRPMFAEQALLYCHLARLLARSQCHWVSLTDGPFLTDAMLRAIPESSRVIVVSDFDVLAPDRGAAMAEHWKQLFVLLQQQGHQLSSFGSEGTVPSALCRHYPIISATADAAIVAALVAAMARVGKSSANRLRYFRSVLPGSGLSRLADEITVWNHPDRQPAHPEQWAIKANQLRNWLTHFSDLELPIHDALTRALLRWRESVPGDTAGFEAMIGSSAKLESAPDGSTFGSVLERARQNETAFEALDRWLRSNNTVFCQIASHHQDNPALEPLLQAAQETARRHKLPQPMGLHYLISPTNEFGAYKQSGDGLEWVYWSTLDQQVPLTVHRGVGPWLDVSTQTVLAANTLLTGERYRLQSPIERITLTKLQTPVWAMSYWRDSGGVFATHSDEVVFHLYEADHQRRTARWEAIDNVWPWATAAGVDDYGLWAEFSVNHVTQRLRWIPPGEFLMGSPEDEPERRDNELPHHVTLTEGYWLADTTCTQALWEAVMGSNPSSFKGLDRPVETVSWDAVMDFIERLNKKVPGLQSQLPTEAQWEYAARAGNQSAFWWGSTLSPEQANYDGNYPYADGEKGQSRKETVAVKEFEANPCGLYQVHGNVWEWCEDGYGAYESTAVVNPRGAESGEWRVIRGGSWDDDGRRLRAAVRGSGEPVFRDYDLGFRLCAGQSGAEPR